MLRSGQLSLTIACFIIYCSGTSSGRRITQRCNKKNLPTSCQALGKLSLALVGGLKQDPGRSVFHPPSFPLPRMTPNRARASLCRNRLQKMGIWGFPGSVSKQAASDPQATPPAPRAAAALPWACKRGRSARLSAGHVRTTG